MVLHGGLQKAHAGQPGGDVLRYQQHQKGSAAADDHRVDQYAQRLHKTHLYRVVALGGGSGAGGRAAACLVGKQPALDAVHQHRTKAACGHLTQAEGLGKDARQHGGQLPDIQHHNAHRDDKVAHRHDRYDEVKAFYGGVFAQYDQRRQQGKHYGGGQRRDVKGVFKGRADRVGDDLADAAPADQTGHRKQRCTHRALEFFAPLALGQHMKVVGRAAPPAAVQRVRHAVLLRQSGLHKGGGSTQQGCDPHPEHRARAACRNSGYHAHKVAHAHPGGGGDDQCLEGGKPARSLLFFAHCADHIPEQAHRQQPCAQGKADTGCKQQHHHKGDANATRHRQGE